MGGRLEDHEAFLRAIFDAPDDDTPRLVYADFLEENGGAERAAVIRNQCGHGPALPVSVPAGRGLGLPRKTTTVALDALATPEEFRWDLVRNSPETFAVEGVRLGSGVISSAEPLDTLFGLTAFARATEFHLGGEVEEVPAAPETEDHGTFALIDMNVTPVITVEGVVALSRHRGARRIEALILTHNNLDNDAARAIVRSPHLIRLKRLEILEGNNLRGRTWQQLLEKYGESVVG